MWTDENLNLLAGNNNQKLKDKTGNDMNEKVGWPREVNGHLAPLTIWMKIALLN